MNMKKNVYVCVCIYIHIYTHSSSYVCIYFRKYIFFQNIYILKLTQN